MLPDFSKNHNYLFSAPQRPECVRDFECPSSLRCYKEKCENPCELTTCGTNAECEVQNHKATCRCSPGFLGDPFVNCSRGKQSTFFDFFTRNSVFPFFNFH